MNATKENSKLRRLLEGLREFLPEQTEIILRKMDAGEITEAEASEAALKSVVILFRRSSEIGSFWIRLLSLQPRT